MYRRPAAHRSFDVIEERKAHMLTASRNAGAVGEDLQALADVDRPDGRATRLAPPPLNPLRLEIGGRTSLNAQPRAPIWLQLS